MNAIQLLSAQPWVERLGWTLLHFLWQGVLIAAVYAAIRKWIAHSAGPNTTIFAGVRGTRRYGRRSAHHLDPAATDSSRHGPSPGTFRGDFPRCLRGCRHHDDRVAAHRRTARTAGAPSVVGGGPLARRRDGLLAPLTGRLDLRGAPSLAAGPSRAERMAAGTRPAQDPHTCFAPGPPAGVIAGAGAGGGGLASSRRTGAGWRAGRFAGRADRGASGSRTGAHSPPRLSGQRAAERGRGFAVLPSRGLVGIGPHPHGARAVLRRRGGIRQRRRPDLRPRPGGVGIGASGPFQGCDGRDRRFARAPYRQVVRTVTPRFSDSFRARNHRRRDAPGHHCVCCIWPDGGAAEV